MVLEAAVKQADEKQRTMQESMGRIHAVHLQPPTPPDTGKRQQQQREHRHSMAQPVHVAAYQGDLVEVNRLLEEDPSLLDARADNGSNVLVCAILGQDAVVERLLALGADVNARNEYGFTAAHWACFRNHASTLTLLLVNDRLASLSVSWRRRPPAALFETPTTNKPFLRRRTNRLPTHAHNHILCTDHHHPARASPWRRRHLRCSSGSSSSLRSA
jgi:ankyrin repeat protein